MPLYSHSNANECRSHYGIVLPDDCKYLLLESLNNELMLLVDRYSVHGSTLVNPRLMLCMHA